MHTQVNSTYSLNPFSWNWYLTIIMCLSTNTLNTAHSWFVFSHSLSKLVKSTSTSLENCAPDSSYKLVIKHWHGSDRVLLFLWMFTPHHQTPATSYWISSGAKSGILHQDHTSTLHINLCRLILWIHVTYHDSSWKDTNNNHKWFLCRVAEWTLMSHIMLSSHHHWSTGLRLDHCKTWMVSLTALESVTSAISNTLIIHKGNKMKSSAIMKTPMM